MKKYEEMTPDEIEELEAAAERSIANFPDVRGPDGKMYRLKAWRRPAEPAQASITVVENPAFEPGMALLINGKDKVWITNIEKGTTLTVKELNMWQRFRLFLAILPYRIATFFYRSYVAILSRFVAILKNRDK